MLTHLSVQNYALISALEIDFDPGFSVITGETGAGKSILLGALSLLSGQRADASVVLNPSRKCVVKGIFSLHAYGLQEFFRENDLDYADETYLRREISPEGRSRAFINDMPVTAGLLKSLGDQLIDIHSQHNNLYLEDPVFQRKILDTFALQQQELQEYEVRFKQWRKAVQTEEHLREEILRAESERDDIQFRLSELEKAMLKGGEQEPLEQEQKLLENAEALRSGFEGLYEALDGETLSVLGLLRDVALILKKIAPFSSQAQHLLERIESVQIELKDISRESASLAASTEMDPIRLQWIGERLDLLYSLQQIHKVQNIESLLEIRDQLEERLSGIRNMDERLREAEQATLDCWQEVETRAKALSQGRFSVIPQIEQRMKDLLSRLGMPYAVFRIGFSEAEALSISGKDKVQFLFSANASVEPSDLSKVASGGEMSRLMLSLKAAVAERIALPILVFDEIDSGVSGEMADKMAGVMREMAAYAQIISISHLPQIAAKGDAHYLAYKESSEKNAHSNIRKLNPEERIQELARMLSGAEVTGAALENARVLFQSTSR